MILACFMMVYALFYWHFGVRWFWWFYDDF